MFEVIGETMTSGIKWATMVGHGRKCFHTSLSLRTTGIQQLLLMVSDSDRMSSKVSSCG